MKTKLDQIREIAQRDANRANTPLAILNLNRYSPLYVIRSWKEQYSEPDYAAASGFVERIDP